MRRLRHHPGVAHYLIHLYDYPPIAERGLEAAKRYAAIAPAAPHAQHMPSHIFTRVGLWKKSIASNAASAKAAKESKEPDDQMHGMDYMVYAYLQLSQDKRAREASTRWRRCTATSGRPAPSRSPRARRATRSSGRIGRPRRI